MNDSWRCELYVLSDCVMYFSNGNDGYQLLACYGWYVGYVSEVRLENFDTSGKYKEDGTLVTDLTEYADEQIKALKNADLDKIFGYCHITKLVLGDNFVPGTPTVDAGDGEYTYDKDWIFDHTAGSDGDQKVRNYVIVEITYPKDWTGPEAELASETATDSDG